MSFILIEDALRILVILFGGAVVGAGFPILRERALHYGRDKLRMGAKAMYSLMIVNALVLTFISAVLIDRWNEPISWRWFVALAAFTAKAVFFHWLRAVGIEQERRIIADRRARLA